MGCRKSRVVHAQMLDKSIAKRATSESPQVGVLSPQLWSLVVEDLIRLLNDKGIWTQEFADDIVIVANGKLPGAVDAGIR
ncbi:hypothetical protein QE152_g12409 [Popillia japonica]|uniref:Reverse transcriptase n=1 Tax=Popillia japonica TaxID=7064 RepID=A0AAW1LS97_POPJA